MDDKRVCRICGKELTDEKDVCPECEALLNKLSDQEPDEAEEQTEQDPVRKNIEAAAEEAMSVNISDLEDEDEDEPEEESSGDPMSKSSWLWYVIPLASVLVVFAVFFVVQNRSSKSSDPSSSEDSSQTSTTTTTTTAADEPSAAEDDSSYSSGYTETPTEPTDGKPGGRYIFSKAFDGDKEVDLSPDIDINTFYFHFNGDGSGVYSSPSGATQMAWKDGSLSTDNGLEAKYILEEDQLTVSEGSTKLIFIHESVYEDTREKPEGKYVYYEGYMDGEKLPESDAVTAENTYMIFNSDGTGTASGASGTSEFTWKDGKINYADKTDATYVLHGDKLTLYEITSTVIMVKSEE